MITNYFELEEFPVLIIGNKADKERNVKKEEIEEFLKNEKFIGYYEVSSKTLLNIEESIDFMIDNIYEKEKVFPIDETMDKKHSKK